MKPTPKSKTNKYVPSGANNQLRLYANDIILRLFDAKEYDQIEILYLYAKHALADLDAKAKTENNDPNPYGYSRGEYLRFVAVARSEGWEYDSSPGTENSNEFWWAHGGAFEKVREDSLMTKLHDQFCTRTK